MEGKVENMLEHMTELVDDVSDSLTLLVRNLDRIANKMESKPTFNNYSNNYQSKVDIDRDSSEYKNKRNIYVKKLNEKVIKEPKQSSLDYYPVKYKEDTKKYV